MTTTTKTMAEQVGELYRGAVFDTHIHFLRDAWDEIGTRSVFEKLDANGIERALVSSIPDDGKVGRASCRERV